MWFGLFRLSASSQRNALTGPLALPPSSVWHSLCEPGLFVGFRSTTGSSIYGLILMHYLILGACNTPPLKRRCSTHRGQRGKAYAVLTLLRCTGFTIPIPSYPSRIALAAGVSDFFFLYFFCTNKYTRFKK